MSIVDWDLIELNNNLEIISQLNRLLKIDPELTNKLVNTRYPVSEEYKNSEFVYSDEGAGLIGVLSGLIIDTEIFRIAANYDDNNILIGFILLKLSDDGKFIKA